MSARSSVAFLLLLSWLSCRPAKPLPEALSTDQMTMLALQHAPNSSVALDARWRFLQAGRQVSEATGVGLRLFVQLADARRSRRLFDQLAGALDPSDPVLNQLCTGEAWLRWLQGAAENAHTGFLDWAERDCKVPDPEVYRLAERWIEVAMVRNKPLAALGLDWLHQHLPRADKLRVRYVELLRAAGRREQACTEARALQTLRPYDHRIRNLLQACHL